MSEQWMAEHKGRYLRTVGYVWDCGDPVCDCTQAHVSEVYENKTDPRWIVWVGLWEGEFHSDGEPGAEDELAAYREQLRQSDPEREAAIEWSL